MPSASLSTRRFAIATVLVALSGSPVRAQDLPEGFVEETVFSGLTAPTAIRFHPDGRVFVAEKRGRVVVFDDLDDTTPTTFVDISDRVHNYWDRGLLGIALHPDWGGNPYVYLLYTLDARPGENPPSWNDLCPDPPGPTDDGCVVQGRLSRFRADGDMSTGGEQVLIQNWCQQFPSHSIGSIEFGPDGMLYVTGGDGASFERVDFGRDGAPTNPCGDPPVAIGAMQMAPSAEGGALRSQDLRTSNDPVGLDGTLLRVDPATGLGVEGNPLYGGGTATDDGIIAYGLRNPFRFAIRPGTDEIWIGDVGWNTWEEVDIVADPTDAVVENFGWPCYEGNGRQPGYDQANLTLCENLYASAGAHTQPFYAYDHAAPVATGDGCGVDSGAISGLAFYAGDNFPEEFSGALIFADYPRRCIWAMMPDSNGRPDPTRRRILDKGAPLPVDLAVGPDGYVYYVSLEANEVRRIRYLNGAPAARLTADPLSGATPLLVRFDASGSSDPNGDALTFAWDFDGDSDFNDASSAMPTHTFTTPGSHNVRVRVSDPGGRSSIASVVIEAGNDPPVATIDAPASSLLWRVGDTIDFSGHATDPQQGDLPGTALSWDIVVQHCTAPNVCHEHVIFGISGMASGSFPAPDHGYPSYLEVRLTATDERGLTHKTLVELQPATTTLEVTSTPAGIPIAVGSASQPAPFMLTGTIGSVQSFSAPASEVIGGLEYEFVSWSNGVTTTTQDFALPEGDTALSATYRARCGNGELQDGEACDDGNNADGDCCSPTCTIEEQGTPCSDDGNHCTVDACDDGGQCTHEDSDDCSPLGAECDEDEDCTSAHCVDAVCCDEACGGGAEGDCQACSVERGAEADGECAPVAAETPCRAADGACDREEQCDGESVECPEDEPIDNCCADDGDCDDDDPCTVDTCPEAGGSCSHEERDECDGPQPNDGGAGRGPDDAGDAAVDAGDAGDAGTTKLSDDGCKCSTPGAPTSPSRGGWLLMTLLFGAAFVRKRRSR